MSLLRRFLRLFFWHFYHGFAWTYDVVAAVVSIGRWNDWVRAALPYVEGARVLEIGHGPGHLQLDLRQTGRQVMGLDESRQMGRLARNRLLRGRFTEINLVRGIAQRLPFPPRAFDTVVSTFPAEYIFEPQTISEIKRVLRDGGCYVLLPAAWIVGRKTLDRLASWLFRSTKQVPELPAEVFSGRLRTQLEQAGFHSQAETVQLRSSEVLVIIARL
jgi:ubiquinone/menaquinone biosynthesis C-methylase UbiE